MPRVRRYPAPYVITTKWGVYGVCSEGLRGVGRTEKEALIDWLRQYEIANGPIPCGNYTEVIAQWYRPHRSRMRYGRTGPIEDVS